MINIELYCHIPSFAHCIGSPHQLNAVTVTVLPLSPSLTQSVFIHLWAAFRVSVSLFLICIVSFSLRLSFFGSHGMITYNHTSSISIHVRIFWLVPWARSLFMLVWKSVGTVLLTSEQVCCNRLNWCSLLFFVIGIWYNDYNKKFNFKFFFHKSNVFLSTSYHSYIISSVH